MTAVSPKGPAPSATTAGVVVLGSGALARGVHAALVAADVARCSLLESEPTDAVRALAEATLVVCALEGSTLLPAVNSAAIATGTIALFVRVSGAGIVLGPTVVPGASPCLACVATALGGESGASPPLACGVLEGEAATVDALVAIAALKVVREVRAVLGRDGLPDLLAGVEQIRPTPDVVYRSFDRVADCATCAHTEASTEEPWRARLVDLAKIELDGRVAHEFFLANSPPEPSHATAYKRIGIIGGGTAGYLAALTLRALRPDLDVTLVESSRIPIIGVGEATTSEIVPFLHKILGFDVLEFYQQVQPTFKLGIRFEWGLPGDYHFNYPFDRGRPREALHYDGHLGNSSFLSVLMDDGRAPLLSMRGEPYSLLAAYPYAYHLDNKRFVGYLAARAKAAGVHYLDREIVDATVAADGTTVESLTTRDGEKLDFDLYVDCSGFRSMLLEKHMGSKFVSFASSLLTDTAIAAEVPHGGIVKPFTTAESMEHGWCWNIPMLDQDHRGYVFSSAFCTPEQAVAEMRAKNPKMGDHRVIKFRSGRHEELIKGNVVAIGNAYGFVEPLESTGIQMILFECLWLAKLMPRDAHDSGGRHVLNTLAANRWDYIRWFLALHYRFNRRFDTPFWQTCNRDVDVSGAAQILALYRQGGPLIDREVPGVRQLLNFNTFGNDVLLLGQQVAGEFIPPQESRAAFDRRTRAYRALSARALPHREGLAQLVADPALLYDAINQDHGWVSRFETELRTSVG